MGKDKITDLLNQDLEGEHAAIIQFLPYACTELRVALRENPATSRRMSALCRAPKASG